MKQTNLHPRRILATILLLAVSVISWAYNFEEDGIYYNINADGTSVSVTHGDWEYKNADKIGYSGEIVIPSVVSHNGKEYNVTSIGESAFAGCNGLTAITIPNSVTSIGECAFDHCFYMTTLTIPNGVTNIGKEAFAACSSLIIISLPSTITSIGDRAFDGCWSVKEIYCFATQVPEIGRETFHLSYGALTHLVYLYVPSSALDDYKNADHDKWGSFLAHVSAIEFDFVADGIYYNINDDGTSVSVTYKAEENLDLDNDYMLKFYNCYSGDVVIPSTVTYDGKEYSVTGIGKNAFSMCSGLTSVTIPNSVTSIGERAFLDCI